MTHLTPWRHRIRGPHVPWRRARAVKVVAIVGLLLVAQGCVLRYPFDSVSDPVASAADASGLGHTGTVETNNKPGARIDEITPGHDGTGSAVSYPEVCPNTDSSCPRVVITTPDTANLNPGTRDFSYGLRVRVSLDELTADHGSNLIQKGKSNTAQYKVQLDDPVTGRPMCVLRSGADITNPIRLSASVSVADGTWHQVSCDRTDDELSILVDGNVRGTATLPTNLSITPTDQPFTVGGYGAFRQNDQYHGDLDEVFIHLN